MKSKHTLILLILVNMVLMTTVLLSGCLSDDNDAVNQYDSSDRVENDPSSSNLRNIMSGENVVEESSDSSMDSENTNSLIQTSNSLPSSSDVDVIVEDVIPNFKVTQIVGGRMADYIDDFKYINITMEVMAGADSIDIERFKISVQSKSTHLDGIVYAPESISLTSSTFNVVEVKDDDSSLSIASVANSDDIFNIVLKPDTSMIIPTREPIRIEIKPEYGSSTIVELTTPSSYGVKTNILLYP